MIRIERTKGGLLNDSYVWILSHKDFIEWRDRDETRLLWIRGDPGKGKTMLLIGIIRELQKSIQPLSYFFCQGTDSRLNNATAVLRGLMYQLLMQQRFLISPPRRVRQSRATAVRRYQWIRCFIQDIHHNARRPTSYKSLLSCRCS